MRPGHLHPVVHHPSSCAGNQPCSIQPTVQDVQLICTIPVLTANMQLQTLLLLPMAFLLPPRTWADKIIGGKQAKPHSRPYMAHLSVRHGNKSFFCGGFLVSENFVLTAAHCNGDEIIVKLGAHNIKLWEWKRQKISVCHQIPHPQYNEDTDDNDIMLLKLVKRAKLNKWVKTIALPHAGERVKPGAVCSVAGWGSTSTESESYPATLQEVDVEVLEDAACLRNPKGSYCHYNTSTMMCVGDSAYDKNSDMGDSGGPLVCGEKVQGIVSWETEDRTPPAVYTRVSTFIPWIQEMMNRL
ncbi:mast cell protease 1A-like [Mauremys mutica]|uniref:mast cell protease 1A-like n=1 Tax=Mauremys mutica TaxID=74926 RepID=UPI001D1618CA|nr:mast cell protease 1A-like [Mauremys mutica]